MVTNGNQNLTCIVTGCNNSKALLPEKKFFSLPSEEERYHQWVLVCQREDLLGDRKKNINHFICSDHFISNQFEDNLKTLLKDNAIPTVFPFYNNVQAYSAANILLEGKLFKNDKETNVDNDSTCSEALGHPTQLCRLCASTVEEAVYIFSSSGLDLNLPEKINRSLPVTVRKTDPLPKQLCVNCVMKVSMCDEFSESCLEAEKRLIALMKHKHFRSHTTGIQCEVFCSSNIALDSVVEDCQSYEDIDTDNLDGSSEKNRNVVDLDEQDPNSKLYDSYCCPLCFKGRINIKNNVTCSFNKGKNSTNQSTEPESERIKPGNSYSGDENPVVQELQKESEQKHDELIKSGDESEWQYAHYSDSESRKSSEKPAGSDFSEWWDVENAVLNPEIVIETLDTKSLVQYDNDNENGQENGDYIIADEEQIILVKEEKNESNYYCRLCTEQLHTLESCLEHSKLHVDADKYSCILCDSSFSCESELLTHFEDHRLQESKNKTKKKRIICSNCNRRFNGERTFLQHSCVSPTKYRCSTCNRAYNSEERLAFHQKFHEGKESYNCDYCNKSFDNEAALYYHTCLVHYDERPFHCHICNKKFWAKVSLDLHLRVHSGERPYECHFCNKKFFDKQTQRKHLVTHIKGKPYKCDYCGICLGRMSLLKEHIKRYHLNTCRPKRLPSLIHYYCKICDTTFTNSAEVVSHRTKHWGAQEQSTESVNGHICEFCGETFNDVLALGRHRRIKHSDEKPYVCSMCNERSHTLYEARIHRKIHTEPESKDTKINFDNINTFICESCGNIFSDKRTFMKHLKQHKTNANIPCEVCGKLFAEKQNMTVHMRLHTGEKPYTCEICGKKFAQTSALYTHALLHTGEKPHSCDLCGKSFRIKADRDNHRRTHTGEKPYKCEFCGKQFRTGQVYYQHRMIHTGERRFPCNVCGKAFKRSHTLVVHKRIHTGEKPNICDICGKGFRQRSDMRKHRSIHSVDGVMPKPHT